MNLGRRLRGAALAAVVLVLTVGCTAGSADAPTSTAIVSVTVSPSVIDPSSLRPSSSEPSPSASPSVPSSAAESSASPPSSEISPQEAADRAAIEAQWVKFWRTYAEMIRTPDDQRDALLSEVVTSPLKEKMVDESRSANVDGQDNYGYVVHRIYWDIPVGGNSVATIADCQDQTGTGIVDVQTGEKISAGEPRVNIRGQMVKGDDGVWRVQALFVAGKTKC